MATIATRLLTAEDYLKLPNDGRSTELVRGEVVEMNLPTPRHGEICFKTAYLLGRYLEDHPLGRVVSNDAGVLTERDPDTVRGADVAFYSYAKIPPGPLPQGYLAVVPDLVMEVRSTTDRWAQIHAKIGEYLDAGVRVVCVLDEQTHTAHVFDAEESPRVLAPDEDLTLPQVLEDYRVPVRRFFE
jgi:Uma2 family endonuclease